MKLLPYPFSEASSAPAIMGLSILTSFCLFLDHGLCLHLQFFIALNHFVEVEDSLLFLFVLNFLFTAVFDNNSTRVNPKNNVLNIMTVLKFSAWVWTLDKGTFTVTQLAHLIVSPEHECSEVIVCHTMSPSARNVIYHQSSFSFIEEVREIRDHSQVLQMRSSIDTKRAFKVVTTRKDLLKDYA